MVHHGATLPDRADRAARARVRERLGLGDRRVVLCVAAKRPHKNQELLVRAAEQLPDDVVVVLAGHPEPYDAELRRLAAGLGVDGVGGLRGLRAGRRARGTLGHRGCAGFPTRAEGFGMPVLDALARGVPVACSDLAVLREVGGDLPRSSSTRTIR